MTQADTPQRKIAHSIDLMRRAEPLALRMHPDGFHLAFSGGKDSQVLYHIAQMAEVKFKAIMQVTTIDPPELMAFVRNNYPEVELHRPPMNFYQLLEKKGVLPNRYNRWCCSELKEHAGRGQVTLVGVRAAESTRRAKRKEVERMNKNKNRRKQYDDPDILFRATDEMLHQCVKGSDRIVISPLFQWTNSDVWNFIRGNGIEYCKLYDEGFHRIGCVFCPMASPKIHQLERQRYPGVERAFKRSIQRILDINHNHFWTNYCATANEVFDWYISNKRMDEYFGMIRNQTKLEF